mgnify:CR=1 FL=1
MLFSQDKLMDIIAKLKNMKFIRLFTDDIYFCIVSISSN